MDGEVIIHLFISFYLNWFKLPKDEVEKSIRNVLRKNMVRNQYSHYALMEDREVFTIIFDDTNKKTIPFLGEVLQNLPFFSQLTIFFFSTLFNKSILIGLKKKRNRYDASWFAKTCCNYYCEEILNNE